MIKRAEAERESSEADYLNGPCLESSPGLFPRSITAWVLFYKCSREWPALYSLNFQSFDGNLGVIRFVFGWAV